MADDVKKIIQLALEKKSILGGTDLSRRFSLYTKETLSLDDAESVRKLLNRIEDKYDVKIKVVAGGWGCTKFTLEYQGGADDAVDFVKKLMADKEIMSMAEKAKFKLIVVPSAYKRYPIEGGEENSYNDGEDNAYLKTDNLEVGSSPGSLNIHINGSNVSTVQVGNEAVANVKSTQKIKNEGLSEVLSELKECIIRCQEIGTKLKPELIEDVNTLEKELNRTSPREGVVTSIMNHLGNFSSITSIVDRVYPFLPMFAASIG